MAANFIECDQNHPAVRLAIAAILKAREAKEQLRAALLAMEAFRDGDGSQAAHYALLATEAQYQQNGYASANAAAKASYDQFASVYGKISATGGDATGAAIDQACAYHGI